MGVFEQPDNNAAKIKPLFPAQTLLRKNPGHRIRQRRQQGNCGLAQHQDLIQRQEAMKK